MNATTPAKHVAFSVNVKAVVIVRLLVRRLMSPDLFRVIIIIAQSQNEVGLSISACEALANLIEAVTS